MTKGVRCALVAGVAMSLVACSKRIDTPRVAVEPAAVATTQVSDDTQALEEFPPPPPLPPLPGSTFKRIPVDVALKNAIAMGSGDCGDVSKIQGLPLPNEYGADPYFDRIMVHIGSYRTCLLDMTGSTAPTKVVPSYPGVEIHVVGDLAFLLLAGGKQVSWNDCVPKSVIEQKKKHWMAFYSWLDRPGKRAQWSRCLIKQHGG